MKVIKQRLFLHVITNYSYKYQTFFSQCIRPEIDTFTLRVHSPSLLKEKKGTERAREGPFDRVDHRIIAPDNTPRRRRVERELLLSHAPFDFRHCRDGITVFDRSRRSTLTSIFSPLGARRERGITCPPASAFRKACALCTLVCALFRISVAMRPRKITETFPDVAIGRREVNCEGPRTRRQHTGVPRTRRLDSSSSLCVCVRHTAASRMHRCVSAKCYARERERPRRGNANVESSARKYWYARR